MVGMELLFAILLVSLLENWISGAQAATITVQPSNTYAVRNGIAELRCEGNGTAPLKYKWYRNGQRFQSNERRRILINGHLYIKRFVHKRRKGITDTGEYYCTVTDANGQVAQSRTVNMSLGHIRKEFRVHPQGKTVSIGDELSLSCTSPRGKPKPEVHWLKDDRKVKADSDIRIVLSSNKLIIKNFKKEDEGDYQCEATNVAGRKLSHVAHIKSTVAPTIVSHSSDMTVDISIQRKIKLSCQANGLPSPKIIWKKKGSNTILPSVHGLLTLSNLKPRDSGQYECIAFNKEGNDSASVSLILHYTPEITKVSDNVNEMEGVNVELECLAKSQPSPALSWRKSGKREDYKVDYWYGHIRTELRDGTLYLIFKQLKLSDAGNYTCEASNNIGKDKHTVNVAVYRKTEYPPTIVTPSVKISVDINSNATIICDVDGNPKPTVKWSKVGQDEGLDDGIISKEENVGKKYRYSLFISKIQTSNGGTFRCVASNKIKGVHKSIVMDVSRKLHLSQPIKSSGVPRMPTNVRVREYNDKSVRITWYHCEDPVLAYAVGYINVDLRSKEQYAAYDVSATATQYVVQGLKPNTRYMFFVRGINEIGRGVPSLLSDVVRTKPTQVLVTTPTTKQPGRLPKLKISLSSAGAGELDVTWGRLDKDISIDGFYIYWKVKGFEYQREILQNKQATHYKIADLQNSTKYTVRVRVFKKSNIGPWSKSVHQWTTNEPVALEIGVTQNDSDSLTITWKRLWKKYSGKDTLLTYTIMVISVNNDEEDKRRKRSENDYSISIPASQELYHYVWGNLNPGGSYKVWMSVETTLGRTYMSPKKSVSLTIQHAARDKSTLDQIKDFIIRPWFLGALGGVIFILILVILICCVCRRSSSKKDVDDLPIELQNTNPPETVRKTTSEAQSTENELLSPVTRTTRENLSECDTESGRSSGLYRCSGSPGTPPRSNLDFSNIAITPNKYERMYRSLEAKGNDNVNHGGRPVRKYSENDFDSPSRYNHRSRNPYSPAPRPSCLNIDSCSDYDNERPKCESTPEPAKTRTPSSRTPYPEEAPPDYETAIAENEGNHEKKENTETHDGYKDLPETHLPYKHDRFSNRPSRQSSSSPGSECTNQGSSIVGRRKGLKPPPRLTIASVNWADMLPPPPSHPPPSSVATRSPPPSPTATSMCSETTYGRSHASSFHPRRSASVVSNDMASDLEKETADSVRSGKSKGKSENKLPFDLAGITSDIIMQWADSVTNTSGSDDESACSSPDRRSGISSDGSFLTDTDFANAVKAAAECGGFNIDIDLNMYKAMDPISFQPFAGSLSTYNPESNSSIKAPAKKTVSKDGDGLRDSSRGRRARSENSRDGNLPSVEEDPACVSTNAAETVKNGKAINVNDTSNIGSIGYVPALTRTSALGKIEPVKKKYAVVRKLPQVQAENTPDYSANYPSHSLSSSTSNASTVRSSSCPPAMLSDEDTEDDVI